VPKPTKNPIAWIHITQGLHWIKNKVPISRFISSFLSASEKAKKKKK
jgi:hypothetical protein